MTHFLMTMLQWRWNDALSHHHYRVIAPLFRAIALFCTLKKMVTGLQMENSYITCIFAEFYVLACITRFSVNKHEYFGKCSRQPHFPHPPFFPLNPFSPFLWYISGYHCWFFLFYDGPIDIHESPMSYKNVKLFFDALKKVFTVFLVYIISLVFLSD